MAETRECVVQRATGYTVMSNQHLRDRRLTLKAKGLLSVVLSLPEDWDYTISGLAYICDTGKDAIRAAIQELECAGYISRRQINGASGRFGRNQYIIRETPDVIGAPLSGFPTTENPLTEKPLTEKPLTEKPLTENPTQLNKDISITDIFIPPKSPEKKKRTRRAPVSVLDDVGMDALIRQNVGTLGDTNGWNRYDKNSVYLLVKEFYAPRDCTGSPPKHTARGVNGLFRKMAHNGTCTVQDATEMLLTAIERGWTSVYPREDRGKPMPAAPIASSVNMGAEL